MATITPTATPIVGGYLVEWHGVSAGDTCTAWPNTAGVGSDAGALTDCVVQVTGGTISMEGTMMISSTNATYATLHKVDGTTTVILSAAQICQILEPPLFIRPAPTAAASAVHVFLKRVQSSSRI